LELLITSKLFCLICGSTKDSPELFCLICGST
jgi:hypothetical protein